MGMARAGWVGLILAGAAALPQAARAAGIEIIPGDRRSTTISSATDTDQYQFAGMAGTLLGVTVKRTSGTLNPSIAVFDPLGGAVNVAGNLQTGPGGATLRGFHLPATGTYTVEVSGLGGTTGGYTLTVARAKLPGASGSVTLAAGASVNIPFSGIEGGAVTFSVKHLGSVRSRKPQLLTPALLEVPGSENGIFSAGDEWRGRRVVLFGDFGTYYLRLNGPLAGEPAVVTFHVQPTFAGQSATRVRLPALEPTIGQPTPYTVRPGQTVTVPGSDLSPNARVFLTQPSFPDLEAVVTSIAPDGTSLIFQVPDSASGGYNLRVANPEGQFAIWNDAISVESGVVGSAGIDPTTGPVTGGTLVTIYGAGFQPGITVTLRYDDLSTISLGAANYVSATEINFTTPAATAGTVDIILQNPLAAPATRADAFTFTDVTNSRFFDDATATAVPVLSQSGDAFAASRGAIADLDGDGLNDVILQSGVVLPGGASLRILRQEAPGSFSDNTHGTIPDRFGGFDSAVDIGEGPGLAVGDLDGDDAPDIVLVSKGSVFRSDTAGFNVVYQRANNSGSAGPFGLTRACGKMGDFPIFWNDHYPATRILKNDGNGNFFSSPFTAAGDRRIPLTGFYVPYGGYPAYAAAASQSATFKPIVDPAAANFPGYYTNDPGFVDSGVRGGERFEGDAVAMGDLNGDGAGDLVITRDSYAYEVQKDTVERGNGLKPFERFVRFGRTSTRILLNQPAGGSGTGEFVETSSPLFDPSGFAFPDTGYNDRGQAADVAIGDLDGDGRNDIIIASDTRFTMPPTRPGVTATEYRPGTRIFINRGNGKFDDATRSNLPVVDVGPVASDDFFAANRIALGDLDLDGDPDLVLASSSGAFLAGGRPYTRILLNRDGPDGPTGIFDDVTTASMPAVAGAEVWQANSFALHDIEGDGDLDIVLTSDDPGLTATKAGTRVLINNGAAVFSDAPPGVSADAFIPPTGGAEVWAGDLVLTGDLNGDGLADILISLDDPLAPNATRILFHK